MRLIDADALKEAIEKSTVTIIGYGKAVILDTAYDLIDNAPTVEDRTREVLSLQETIRKLTKERPQGKWELIDNSGRLHRYSCSICGHQISCIPSCLQDYKGCYCGADMRGDTDEIN